MKKSPRNIVISRTDSIGDVVLTLPLAGIIKKQFPDCKVYFLGSTYTLPIIACCPHVDVAWDWKKNQDESKFIQLLKEHEIDTFLHVFPNKTLAKWVKKAKIRLRVGTSHRLYHLYTCNVRVNFTRKKSDLHEAQLNTKLLQPFIGLNQSFTLTELHQFLEFRTPQTTPLQITLNPKKINIIFHAKSQGSAIEWGMENFAQLADELDENKVDIYFTGTEKEGELIADVIPKKNNIFDVTGKFSLTELIVFISKANLLIAASTGPLHLAGVQGILTIGLFADQRPIHPGRWQPLGPHVKIISTKNNLIPNQPLSISVREVKESINAMLIKEDKPSEN